jgi:hypothetical protein
MEREKSREARENGEKRIVALLYWHRSDLRCSGLGQEKAKGKAAGTNERLAETMLV